MRNFKSNQVREAIARTLGAKGERALEIELRIKRLIAADRKFGRRSKSSNVGERHYAFYDGESLGTGADILFTEFEAFALLAAILLLEHGLPQMTVVKLLRQVRHQLQDAHADSLRKKLDKIFDEKVILAEARPGMLAFETTEPVILVFAKLTGSSFDDPKAGAPVKICRSQLEMVEFMKQHRHPGTALSIFEWAKLIHVLHSNLARSTPVSRGRASGMSES